MTSAVHRQVPPIETASRLSIYRKVCGAAPAQHDRLGSGSPRNRSGGTEAGLAAGARCLRTNSALGTAVVAGCVGAACSVFKLGSCPRTSLLSRLNWSRDDSSGPRFLRSQWRLLRAHGSPGDEAGVRARTRGLLNGPDPTLLKVRGYGIALSTREVADSLYWMNAAACLALPHEQPVLRGRSLV